MNLKCLVLHQTWVGLRQVEREGEALGRQWAEVVNFEALGVKLKGLLLQQAWVGLRQVEREGEGLGRQWAEVVNFETLVLKLN